MCTLLFYQGVLGEGTLGLAANRDERPGRPWTPPQVGAVGGESVLYPQDHRGGTWIGTNGRLIAALTNMAPPGGRDVRSRGLLVRDALAGRSLEDAQARVKTLLSQASYDGFNLLLAAPDGAAVLTWHGRTLDSEPLGEGVHLLRHRVRGSAEAAGSENHPRPGDSHHPQEFLHRIAKQALGKHGSEEETCRHGASFATLSSTLIFLDSRDRSRSFFFFAPGPPCSTEFEPWKLP